MKFFKRKEMVPAEHTHTVQVVRNTLTVILPLKQCPLDANSATQLYVAGWNDAMSRASGLIGEVRLGQYEFVPGNYKWNLPEKKS